MTTGTITMIDKDKSIIQENLATLYLRLNGYFSTGFIIHSVDNNISGELDILAIRFPFHEQDDTGHNSSPFLEVPQNLDLIIAEVKSNGQPLQFNKSLRQKTTVQPWCKILSWTGIIKAEEVQTLAQELNDLVQVKPNSQLETFRSSKKIKTNFGDLTVRPILFSPERPNSNNADKFITWTEINDFVWSCLCPVNQRDSCGTRYDFDAWGYGLSEIVRVYKDRQATQNKLKDINELYSEIEIKRNKTIKAQ